MANTCHSQTSIRDRCSYCQKSGEYWLLIGWESENESSNLRLLLVTRFSHVWFIYILDTDSENKELPHFKKVPHTCVNSKISNHTISWEEIINTFHGNNEPVIKRKLVNHVPVTFSLEKLKKFECRNITKHYIILQRKCNHFFVVIWHNLYHFLMKVMLVTMLC